MSSTLDEKLRHRLNQTTGYTNHVGQLGDEIADAKAVVPSELAINEGNVLVGNASNVGAAIDASAGGNILQGNDTTMVALDASAIGAVLVGNGTVLTAPTIGTIGDVLVGDGVSATAVNLPTGSILIGDGTSASALDASLDANILIGDGFTAAMQPISGDVNLQNFGQMTINDGAVTQGKLNPENTVEDFIGPFIQTGPDGAAISTADTAVNLFMTTTGNVFETRIKTADAAASTAPQVTNVADGVDISFDQTDNDIAEITQGITEGTKSFRIVEERPFNFSASFSLDDVSGNDIFLVGLRKAEAYQNDKDNYDEMFGVNVISGDIYTESILNGGATSAVDTTDNLGDGESLEVEFSYDYGVSLGDAINLAEDLRIQMDGHAADGAVHTTAPDGVNFPLTSPPAIDLPSLLTLTTEMLTQYDLHDDDAELGAGWAYHAAQETADHTPTSVVAPTAFGACVQRLNDLRAVFNAHDNDATAHGATGTYQVVSPPVTLIQVQYDINGAGMNPPTVGQDFAFDETEELIPFIYHRFDTTTPDVITLETWDVD